MTKGRLKNFYALQKSGKIGHFKSAAEVKCAEFRHYARPQNENKPFFGMDLAL